MVFIIFVENNKNPMLIRNLCKEMKKYFFDINATEEHLTSKDGINESVQFANNVQR